MTPGLKSTEFWASNGLAVPLATWATQADGQPLALRMAALVVAGLLAATYALCRCLAKNPLVAPALLLGWISRRPAASTPTPPGTVTST